jgi:hypothetical protein
MGKDKFENEELLKWAFNIDIWFHVEGLSSAHVYLRLPEGVGIDNIPTDVLNECFQLVKDNSKDGRKKEKVSVCYTPWENLLKRSDMDVGEVGYKNENNVKIANGIEKDNEILKVLKKTMEEKTVDLETEKEAFTREQDSKRKKFYEEKKKKDIEEAKKNKLLANDKRHTYMENVGTSTSNKEKKDLDDDFW